MTKRQTSKRNQLAVTENARRLHCSTKAPFCLPEGIDLELVPEEVRRAVAEVVQPAYEQFVLHADDPLEASLGLTVVHLLWLEILQQYDLKREFGQAAAVLGISGDFGPVIAQQLRVLDAKVKVGHLLVRLREIKQDSDDVRPLAREVEIGKTEIC